MESPRMWHALIPICSLGLVSGLGVALTHLLELNDPSLIPNPMPELKALGSSFDVQVTDWSARHILMVSSLAFFLTILPLLASGWYVAYNALRGFWWRRQLMLGICILGACVFCLNLYKNTHGASATMRALQAHQSQHLGINLEPLHLLMYALGMTALAMLACSASTVLIPDVHDVDPNKTDHEDELFLARRMSWMRWMLYCGSASLAVAMIKNFAVTLTLASYLAHPEDAVIMVRMASTSTMVFGVYFSLLLAAIYLPAEAILKLRANKLARDSSVTANDRDSWLKDRDLKFDIMHEATNVAAMLSPLALAVAGQVTKLV